MHLDDIRSRLTEPKLRRLYANTYYSLLDRPDERGYLEESFVPGRYPGNFARSTGAFVFCMAEAGETEQAERVLRYVLETMKTGFLTRAPHVLGAKPGDLDMTNQPDGTAHILSAFGTLVLEHGCEALYEDYWPLVRSVMDQHTEVPYFFASDICRFPVAQIRLFLNPLFEHSRQERYWCCFDLLTQSFMGAALEKLIRIAALHGDPAEKRWEQKLRWLREGVREHLTRTESGKTVYAEMRLPDSNEGTIFPGQGWVSLSPIAADWEGLEPSVMDATQDALHAELWRQDPLQPNLHYLDKDSGEKPCFETIGKGIGWDLECSLRRGDFDHICETLDFLAVEHEADLYGECMFLRSSVWQTRDHGNAEQCLWWCRAMGRLRKACGLPFAPERSDVTIPYRPVEAEPVQRSIGG